VGTQGKKIAINLVTEFGNYKINQETDNVKTASLAPSGSRVGLPLSQQFVHLLQSSENLLLW
jgi:hypothetical protein